MSDLYTTVVIHALIAARRFRFVHFVSLKHTHICHSLFFFITRSNNISYTYHLLKKSRRRRRRRRRDTSQKVPKN